MNRRSFGREEDRRRTATHEAGHVALLWMLGSEHQIQHVNMRGNRYSAAFVARQCSIDPLKRIEQAKLLSKREVPEYVQRETRAEATYLLAGYAATAMADGDGNWFEDCSYKVLDEHGDLPKAYGYGFALYADHERAMTFVEEAAAWADDAVADTQLTQVISRVTEVLVKASVRTTGDRIRKIVRMAASIDDELPYRVMGDVWRERFDGKV